MFNKQITIEKLKYRKNILQQRDPVANVNIIRKIDRLLRKLCL